MSTIQYHPATHGEVAGRLACLCYPSTACLPEELLLWYLPSSPPHLIYLHGFASSPASRKARYLAQRFHEAGVEMETPDLAQANFGHLTISAQLQLIDRIVGGKPVSLIGSSLGGYLAALYAASHLEVAKLVLLAPAFGFLDLWKQRLGPKAWERWRDTGKLAVYHYGDKRERNLHFELMVDAGRYPLVPDFTQPALLLHGISDDTVPVSASADFVAGHPNARLVQLESDHDLGNVLDRIWQESSEFLLGSPLVKSVIG